MKNGAIVTLALSLLLGCSTPRVQPFGESSSADTTAKMLERVTALSAAELDSPLLQMEIGEAFTAADDSGQRKLVQYLYDPDAVEYALVNSGYMDGAVLQRLLGFVMDDEARGRIAVRARASPIRVAAAMAVRGSAVRMEVICKSKDAAVRNAYAETLGANELDILWTLTSDSDCDVAAKAERRYRELSRARLK